MWLAVAMIEHFGSRQMPLPVICSSLKGTEERIEKRIIVRFTPTRLSWTLEATARPVSKSTIDNSLFIRHELHSLDGGWDHVCDGRPFPICAKAYGMAREGQHYAHKLRLDPLALSIGAVSLSSGVTVCG